MLTRGTTTWAGPPILNILSVSSPAAEPNCSICPPVWIGGSYCRRPSARGTLDALAQEDVLVIAALGRGVHALPGQWRPTPGSRSSFPLRRPAALRRCVRHQWRLRSQALAAGLPVVVGGTTEDKPMVRSKIAGSRLNPEHGALPCGPTRSAAQETAENLVLLEGGSWAVRWRRASRRESALLRRATAGPRPRRTRGPRSRRGRGR